MKLIDFYRQYISKTKMTKRDLKSYGSFGNKSVMDLPCIHDNHRSNVYIGDNTTILKNSRIQLYTSKDGKVGRIKIGNNCFFSYNMSLLAFDDIVIADGVLFASNVLVTSENHGIDPESNLYYMDQELSGGAVHIGEGSWIGEKAIILPGVSIGKKCVVGAGSIVTKTIPDFSIAVGNPAHVIKRYNFDLHQWEKV